VELLNQRDFDLMLLDLKMPGMSGIQVLEVAQKVRPGTVVILLTAHATLDSAISAMRRGAFDYLLKPCEPRALIAGVERGLAKRAEFLRRQNLVGLMEQTVSALKTDDKPLATSPTTQPAKEETLLHAADITVDIKKRMALLDNRPLTLSPTEFSVLAHFVRYPDRAIPCAELVRDSMGYECSEQEARPVMRVHIHRLRQKIEADPDKPRRLVTVRAAGYMLVTET
jgi:DNA-binding response OmpR family regulator